MGYVFKWLVNGVPFLVNPDGYILTPMSPNVTYSTLASGRQARQQTRRLVSANQLELDWHKASESTRRQVSLLTQTSGLSKIVLVGMKPTLAIWSYLDTMKITSSDGNREGINPLNAGHRRDLQVVGNTDGPFYHSYWNVPDALSVSPSYVQSAFLGQYLTSSMDSIPNWSGNAWQQVIPFNAPMKFSNLGTAEWSPFMVINGPFSSLTLNVTYENVDGTGAGVSFTWLGSPVNSGDCITIDTASMRVYHTVSGSQNEVVTWSLYTASNGIPYPDWPPFPMGDFVITATALAGNNSNTTIDLSNFGTETFLYR